MNKKYFPYFVIFACIVGILYFAYNFYIHTYLDIYAQTATEQFYGSQRLSGDYENMIRDIAREMNLDESFEIRKMNPQALQLFGYCNAFAYFPQSFNFIPISNKPFLFVSQGFFESLTLEEQRFLIGHELIHIREHHAQYLNLVLYLIFGILLVIWWRATKLLSKFFESFQKRYLKHIGTLFSVLLLFMCLIIPRLIERAYRRHIEWQADQISLELLQTYDGGICLMDRWQKEFKIPHNSIAKGLFADHPSCDERKLYCYKIKNINESVLCTSKNY